ncbi:MAG: SOS response-associated peptidase [Bradyrhizobium sp.]
MCGRFTQHFTWREIRDLYGLTSPAPRTDMPARYKICPTNTVNTVRLVRGRRTLGPTRWGLVPGWWQLGIAPTNTATFNAPVETVATIPLFRSSFGRRHCLIPVSGYYERKNTSDGRQPYYFTRRDGSVMTIAGLWDEWRNPDTNELIRSCTMMIGAPNKFAAEVRDQMPVILEPDQFDPWLFGEAGPKLLKPAGERVLKKHPVSKRVDGSRASDADETLIEEVALPVRIPHARRASGVGDTKTKLEAE